MSKTKFANQQRFSEKIRRKEPLLGKKDGKVEALLCPFCKEPHPISVDQVAMCGTFLEIRAVQPTFTGKLIACARCGKTGSTLTKMGENLYVHVDPCVPKNFYTEPPKLSRLAALAWKMPDKLMIQFAKTFKIVPEELVKMNELGVSTGEIVGYHFKKV